MVEKFGEGVPAEIVVAVSLDMFVTVLVTVEELWTIDFVFIMFMLVDVIVVAAVLSDGVVMLLQFSLQQNVLIS